MKSLKYGYILIFIGIGLPVFAYAWLSGGINEAMSSLIPILIISTIASLVFTLLNFTLGRLILNNMSSALVNAGLSIILLSFINIVMHWPGVVVLAGSGILLFLCGLIRLIFKNSANQVMD